MSYATDLCEALAQCIEAQGESEPGEDMGLLHVIDLRIEQLTERLVEMGECAAETRAAIKRARLR